MMIPERPSLERRVLTALEGTASGVPEFPSCSGAVAPGARHCSCACAICSGAARASTSTSSASPRRPSGCSRRSATCRRSRSSRAAAARSRCDRAMAFDATLAWLGAARAPGDAPATFLLDEFLELRTFESFPGLRSVLRDLIASLAANGNRFVLTSPLHRARAPRAARCAAPVRDHPRGAAQRRRDPRDAARGLRSRPRRHRPLRGRGRPRARRARAAGPGALRRTARLRAHARRHRDGHGARAAPPIRSARSPRSSRRAAPSRSIAGTATSSASTAPAATARSRRSSRSSPRKSR